MTEDDDVKYVDGQKLYRGVCSICREEFWHKNKFKMKCEKLHPKRTYSALRGIKGIGYDNRGMKARVENSEGSFDGGSFDDAIKAIENN